MEISIYRIKIECDDDITLFVYFDGPQNCEDELLEYFYEKYYTAQPDITKYNIIDITGDPKLQKNYKSSASFHCAVEGLKYAAKFN
jgi:hypothetical protein